MRKDSLSPQHLTSLETSTERSSSFFLPRKKARVRKQNYQNQPTKFPAIKRDAVGRKRKGKARRLYEGMGGPSGRNTQRSLQKSQHFFEVTGDGQKPELSLQKLEKGLKPPKIRKVFQTGRGNSSLCVFISLQAERVHPSPPSATVLSKLHYLPSSRYQRTAF